MLRRWGGPDRDVFYALFADLAQQAFTAELNQNGSASELRSWRIERDPGGSGDIRITVTLESRHIWNLLIRDRDCDPRYRVAEDVAEVFRRGVHVLMDNIEAEVRRIFHIQREEVEMDLQMRAAHAEVEEALRLNLPNDRLYALQQRYHERRREIQEHRGRVRRPGFEFGAPEPGVQRAQQFQQFVEAVQRTPEVATFQQRLADTMGRDLFYGEFPLSPSREAQVAAQARGLKLLKENLTPAQLKQYEAHNHFHVKGGDSGKTYRIHHGRQINIRELDARHRVVCKWCFLPAGALVEGDVMLAQKFSLELQETAVLKVANRFAPDRGYDRPTQVWVDEATTIPAAVWRGVDPAAPSGDRTIITRNPLRSPVYILPDS